MKKILLTLIVVLLCTSGIAVAQSDNLDWGFNVDGVTYCFDGLDCTFDIIGFSGGLTGISDLPSSIDASGIDLTDLTNLTATGLGTASITVEGAGSHVVIFYIDQDLGVSAYDENGAPVNSPLFGQMWEIDEPGDGDSGNGTAGITYFGDLLQFGFVIDGILDNQVFYDALDDQFLGQNGDAAMAIGWEFDLINGQTAIVTVTISEAVPSDPSVFYLRQSDADGQNNNYLSSTIDIFGGQECTPGATQVCSTGLPGVCNAGTQTCDANGFWDACIQDNQASPDDATCDGQDNDCDGTVDEDYQSASTTCGLGVCENVGVVECVSGQIIESCTPLPQEELTDMTCDRRDGDCDGLVDEDYQITDTNCGIGECASTGQMECQNGAEVDSCTEGTPGTEVCGDGVDQDCNGSDLSCSDVDGDGDGVTPGDGDCDDNNDAVYPGAADMVCDGVDNNCDGTADDGYVATATSCGIGECSSTGQTTCVEGVEGDSCQAGLPVAEVCDSLDNDCDGTADNGFNIGSACTVGVGACENSGQTVCTLDGSGTVCNVSPLPAGIEGPADDPTCGDTVDNDCDGVTDDNDSDCIGICQDTGSISIISGQTLSGNPLDLTELVTTDNATDMVYTVSMETTCPEQMSDSIITTFDTWKYNRDNYGDIGTTWKDTGYDDSSWNTGSGAFGHSSQATFISTPIGMRGTPPDYSDAQMSMYFRNTFTICDPGAVTSLRFHGAYDDGMVVYINGAQVIAASVTGNPPAWDAGTIFEDDGQGGLTLLKLGTVSSHAAYMYDPNTPDYIEFDLGSHIDKLVSGNNVIAIGIYNVDNASSDLLFDGELVISHNESFHAAILFAGDDTDAQIVDTTDWTAGEKELEVSGNDATCQTALPPAQETFVFESLPANETDCFDGIDNDGDGQMDCADADCDGVTDGACTTGEPGICSTGLLTCQSGSEVCTADNKPQAEVCDTLDNDCDGQVDEDLSELTTCGIGVCASSGTLECMNGQFIDTCTPGPQAEAMDMTCDGLDGDCDGSVDEDYQVTATGCGTGECASSGQMECVSGLEVDSCQAGTPIAEVCDNMDNDCDGFVDENLTRTTTCGTGECSGNTGTETCSSGEWGNDTCDPLAGAKSEVCDDLDNDCDGTVDENQDCGSDECSGLSWYACKVSDHCEWDNYKCESTGVSDECSGLSWYACKVSDYCRWDDNKCKDPEAEKECPQLSWYECKSRDDQCRWDYNRCKDR
jgi:hypothetical protein